MSEGGKELKASCGCKGQWNACDSSSVERTETTGVLTEPPVGMPWGSKATSPSTTMVAEAAAERLFARACAITMYKVGTACAHASCQSHEVNDKKSEPKGMAKGYAKSGRCQTAMQRASLGWENLAEKVPPCGKVSEVSTTRTVIQDGCPLPKPVANLELMIHKLQPREEESRQCTAFSYVAAM